MTVRSVVKVWRDDDIHLPGHLSPGCQSLVPAFAGSESR